MFETMSAAEALHKLETGVEHGLTHKEAQKRLEENGRNVLAQGKKKTIWKMLLNQVIEPMILILLAGAVLSAILNEISDAVIIVLVVVINAVIGVIQENKAEKALAALKKMSAPKALVRRNGELCEIEAADLVNGDIVILEAGRVVPADLRLIETANLQAEESALTGESVPVEKDAGFIADKPNLPIGDRTNMAYMSTSISYGRGVGVVAYTGNNTEIGKIAHMLEAETDDKTPLQKRLGKLSKTLGIVAIGICLALFGVGILRGLGVIPMLMTSISLAVAAIPEGLPAVVTIVLAMGVQRMSKANSIVRRLPAVEALGSVSVICSDKTGTLTQNKMSVVRAWAEGMTTEEHFQLAQYEDLVRGMVLCNDASIAGESRVGDPTETALLDMGKKTEIDKPELEIRYPRIEELPFDSVRKRMTTVHNVNGSKVAYTKGALDGMLPLCTHIQYGGASRPMTDADREEIRNQSAKMAEDALRVLALAKTDGTGELEKDMTFVGFVGMIDPPRTEVKDAVAKCRRAGITTVMITGDHKATAFAIAKELGIAKDPAQAISGEELDATSPEELAKLAAHLRVFARVSPEHKVRIVDAFKAAGHIVSMTGDGVNDAPSLKRADIGVAMGITGTDVAKGVADMVLTDDNFATIVRAVEEGRKIYENIKKTVLFLVSANLGEVLTLFVSIVAGWPAPLKPVHILWVNLLTDSFPALALGVDPGEKGIMHEKPRNLKEGIMGRHDALFVVLNGILIGALTLAAFILGCYWQSGTFDFSLDNAEAIAHGQTYAFLVLGISQLFYSLNFRSRKISVFAAGIFKNKWLIGAIILGILVQFAVVAVPFLESAFGTRMPDGRGWLLIFGLSVTPLVLNEIVKLCKMAIRAIFRKDAGK